MEIIYRSVCEEGQFFMLAFLSTLKSQSEVPSKKNTMFLLPYPLFLQNSSAILPIFSSLRVIPKPERLCEQKKIMCSRTCINSDH